MGPNAGEDGDTKRNASARGEYVIIALSFVVLLLIPLWVVLGLFEMEEAGQSPHGDMPGMGVSREEFAAETRAFIEKYERPDGCVEPPTVAEENTSGEHGNPVVYIRAMQFEYATAKLCLKSGVTYEFRLMATDVTHGASIQLGSGSLMVRLPSGVEVVQEVTFTDTGCQSTSCLLYCTFYCGPGHQFMRAQIIVG